MALVRAKKSLRVGAVSRSASLATVALVGVKSVERHRRHPVLLRDSIQRVVFDAAEASVPSRHFGISSQVKRQRAWPDSAWIVVLRALKRGRI